MSLSVAGLILAVLILVPNLFFLVLPPRDVLQDMKGTGVSLTVLERIGQAGCLALLVVSEDGGGSASLDAWFFLAVICIAAYYCLWIRYFAGGRVLLSAFEPLGFIPIPMAVFPVAAFAFAAIWDKSIWFGISVIFLAVGHLTNSLHTYGELKKRA